MPASYHRVRLPTVRSPKSVVVTVDAFENDEEIGIAGGGIRLEAKHTLAFVGNRALATVVTSRFKTSPPET
jgi:hypothetical protein